MPQNSSKNVVKPKGKEKKILAGLFHVEEVDIDEEELLEEFNLITSIDSDNKPKKRNVQKPETIANIDLRDLDRIVQDIDNLDIVNEDEEVGQEFENELDMLINQPFPDNTTPELIQSTVGCTKQEEAVISPNFNINVTPSPRSGNTDSINTEDGDHFKKLALEAKRNGNLDLAKQYLLQYQKYNLETSKSAIKESSLDVTVNSSRNTSKINDKSATNEIDYENQFVKILEFYQTAIQKANEEGNSSKSRRMKRIHEDFKLAFDKFKNRIPYDYDQLPVPPSFPSFPRDLVTIQSLPINKTSEEHKDSNSEIDKSVEISQLSINGESKDDISELKKQACDAKRAGNIDLAKKLMTKIKSIQQSSPTQHVQTISKDETFSMQKEHAVINSIETIKKRLLAQNEIVKSTINELTKSAVTHTTDNYKSLQKFSKLELEYVELNTESTKSIPKAVFETRLLPIISQNTKIDDKTCQIIISNINNIKIPTNYGVVVSVSFPFPKDSPQILETTPLKGSSENLTFNQALYFNIDRTDRNFNKIIQRMSISFIVKIPGSLFKKEEILGIGSLKFDDAFNFCSFTKELNLMNPKRPKIATGSILKVSVLFRNPLFGIDIKTVDVNWLFLAEKYPLLLEDLEDIDVSKINCLELLKYEIENISKKLVLLEDRGNRCDIFIGKIILECLKLKQSNLSQTIKKGGITFIKEYLSQLIAEALLEFEKIQFCLKSNQKNLASLHQKRRACIIKEIDIWKKTNHML